MNRAERERMRTELAELAGRQNHWAERFLAEVEFAEGLAELEGKKSWPALIERAAAGVFEASRSGKPGRLAKAVEQAEAMLAPIGKVAKGYTCHLIGHAHIDMNWMWPWPETVATTNDTFITVLKLMEEFGEFTFTQSQASVYALMQEHNPELFERIRRRVAEGRWEVVASQWVEGDKNIASGESLARHLLYTRRYFAEQFALTPEDVAVDWEPDTFGHAATIPTIIRRGAVRHYYLGRPGRGLTERPRAFWWVGPDGSRVLADRGIAWYNGRITPEYARRSLTYWKATGRRDALCPYGVGDHGGGPTRRDLLRAIDMNGWPIYPNFRFSTVRRFFEIVSGQADRLPVLAEELNFEFTGCYTSQSRIKRTNRLAEAYLVEAEAAAAVAWRALGRGYPAEPLRQAWRDTLFGHFHDILPGSCVTATRDYQLGQFQKIAATTGMIKTQSLRALAAAIDTSFAGLPEPEATPPENASIALGAGIGRGTDLGGLSQAGHVIQGPRGFVAFNLTAAARGEVAHCTVWSDFPSDEGGEMRRRRFRVRTPDGRCLPAQMLGSGNYWGYKYADLAFPAEVGPLGYTAYVVEEGEAEDHKPGVAVAGGVQYQGEGNLFVGEMRLENEFLAVRLDGLTGGVVELTDKATGANLADPARPLGVLEYVVERARGMSAWLIGDTKRCVCPLELVSFGPTAQGPHVAAVAGKIKLNDSTITVTYTLKAGQRWLGIDVALTWLERGGPEAGTPALRMRFPLALSGAKARYEIPFGSIERDQAGVQEVPALRWADVNGRSTGAARAAGCAVLNDCKHGHSLDGATLRVSLIRSSYEPDPLPEIGEHAMRFAVVPHGGELSAADLTRLAAAFNSPLQVVSADLHAGRLPPVGQAVASVAPANVILTAVKKAEDEDALVLRLLETAGRAVTAKVELDAAMLGRPSQAVETDLLERPLEKSTAQLAGPTVRVKLPAHGLASVKVNFAP